MRRVFYGKSVVVLAAISLMTAPAWAGNLTIDLDYSYDTNGFFTANPQAGVLMNDAASYYESILSANLGAIDPVAASASDGLPDTWTGVSFNPSNTSAEIDISDPTIAANTIVVYVGGSALSGGSELGLGGFGGFSDSGTQGWLDTVQGRGQAGALGNANTQTAFSPWGGSISFSTTGNWYFGTLAANETVPTGEFDFYSVALHELGHVLGLGTSNVWQNDLVGNITGNFFDGANAVAANGGLDPMVSTDLGHWAEGTMSDIYGTSTLGNATMTPTLVDGTRNLVTNLDVAGLEDMGWAIVPEPAAWPWLAGVVMAGALLWRRKKLSPRRFTAQPGYPCACRR